MWTRLQDLARGGFLTVRSSLLQSRPLWEAACHRNMSLTPRASCLQVNVSNMAAYGSAFRNANKGSKRSNDSPLANTQRREHAYTYQPLSGPQPDPLIFVSSFHHLP